MMNNLMIIFDDIKSNDDKLGTGSNSLLRSQPAQTRFSITIPGFDATCSLYNLKRVDLT